MRINIGCGQTPTEGWRNFDNSPSVRLARIPLLPELLRALRVLEPRQYGYIEFARAHRVEYGVATRRLPLSSGSVDVLYSSHMLEHLDHEEVARFLAEARRLLRSGGTIRLAVPDLHKQVCRYAESGDADEFIASTRLCQPRPKTFAQRLSMLLVGTRHHQWMYDGASLCRLLQAHGFVNPAVLPPGETNIENPEPLDLKERMIDSVYVEASNP